MSAAPAPAAAGHDPQRDYRLIAAAIASARHPRGRQPALADFAAAAGLSPFHFQRLFSRWAGLSPKRFLAALTLERAKRSLRAGDDVLAASLAAGLSGPGRLHDLCVAIEAATPGELKHAGAGMSIAYGVHHGPLGRFVLAASARGVCGLEFIDDADAGPALARLRATWSGARVGEDASATAALAARVFRRPVAGDAPLRVLVRGTNFQVQVWRALLAIPPGAAASYAAVAAAIGRPAATRAVGSAIGANHVAWLIPCHRVLRGDGALGGYRWGLERKQAGLAWEAAATD
jgi:AraC family transcriptional regulator of adaptative response/methylated-DNA-[protein]-cysteine methyltransferase